MQAVNFAKSTGKIKEPNYIAIAAILGSVASIAYNFKQMEKRAELLGRNLNSILSKIVKDKNAKINIIGHSLGARIIHYGLAYNDWSNLNINDCIMLGSAADFDNNDWNDCAAKISGKLYNLYSNKDIILKRITPDFRRRAGLYPLRGNSKKISNKRMKSESIWVHTEYWDRLSEFLEKGWKGYQPSTKLLNEVQCPICSQELIIPKNEEMFCKRSKFNAYPNIAKLFYDFPINLREKFHGKKTNQR